MDPNAYNPNPGSRDPNAPYGAQPGYGQNYQQPGQPGAYPSGPPSPSTPQQPYPQQPAQVGYQRLQPLQPNPYAGYNPNPYPGETGTSSSKRNPGKMIFIIIAIVVVVAVAIAYVLATSKNGSSSTGKTQTTNNTQTTTNSNSNDDVIPRTDGQLDLSAKIDTSSSIKEQTIKAKIKEQINLSSGFSFMVTKIEPYTPADPAVKPGTGKQFVALSVDVGNRAQTNAVSVSYLDFKLRDISNNLLAGHASTQAILGNALANPTSLKPGEQVAGKIVFEVNATDTDWVLIHKESYQKTTDNTTFSVEGDISVSTAPSSTTSATPPAAATPTKQ